MAVFDKSTLVRPSVFFFPFSNIIYLVQCIPDPTDRLENTMQKPHGNAYLFFFIFFYLSKNANKKVVSIDPEKDSHFLFNVLLLLKENSKNMRKKPSMGLSAIYFSFSFF